MVQLTFNTFIAILSVAAVTSASPYTRPSKIKVLAREALPFSPAPRVSMMVRAAPPDAGNPNNGNQGNGGSNGNSGGGKGKSSVIERNLKASLTEFLRYGIVRS